MLDVLRPNRKSQTHHNHPAEGKEITHRRRRHHGQINNLEKMGKKKGNQDSEKKAALQAKKEAKQEKAARKRLAKQQGKEPTADNEELDQVLQAYKSQEKVESIDKPTLENIETPFPLPRANATLEYCAEEKKDNFYLFGGEYFDGIENVVLDELLRYDVHKKEWKKILTSPRPPPRCAHSCVSYKQNLYVFAGELATADQYHHYRDLWKFDLNKLTWSEIKAKNPPSARSGHACFVWKSYMIVFGGFFEALRETKWYNDVHVFNFQTETWMDVPQSRLSAKPEPRSSCNVALYTTDRVIIHGGFSKMKTTNAAAETKVHSDAWVLHLAPLLQQKPPTWERFMSSSKGNGNRAGTASISYKNRMLVFGGVVDSEGNHHNVDSVFYNDLMALDMERRKWFPLRVKDKSSGSGRRRKVKKGDEKSGDTIDEKEDDDESTSSELEEEEAGEDENQNEGWSLDMLRTNMFAFIDGDGNIVYEKIEDDIANGMDSPKQEEIKEEEEEEEKEEEKEEEAKIGAVVGEIHLKPASKKPLKQMTASSVMVVNPETNVPEAVERAEPLPRINASILVHGHTMYIYGGILEVGDREISLDDMWTLDLRKREKWQCIWQGSMHKQVWRGAIYDDDDSYISTGREDGSDDDDDYSDENEDETMIGEMSTTKQSLKTTNRSGLRQEIAELNEKYGLEDLNRTPGSGETLADFYSRTAIYWNGHAAEVVVGTGGELSNKEVKREGFKLAKDRYEELKPVLDKLAEMEIGSSKSDRSSERSSKGEKKKEKSKKSSKR